MKIMIDISTSNLPDIQMPIEYLGIPENEEAATELGEFIDLLRTLIVDHNITEIRYLAEALLAGLSIYEMRSLNL